MAKKLPSLAKLSPPSLPAVLARLRLFRLLDDACRCPVVWIVRPPGSGKTTLTASYLRARRRPTLWYQLDEGDSDPATFFHYLGLAVHQIKPRKRMTLPHLTPEFHPCLSTFAQRFFEQMFRYVPVPTTVVFDNYQVLQKDSPVHEVIRTATSLFPTETRMVVMSRAEPPETLARLQAERRVALIYQDALRFTKTETARLLRGRVKGRRGDFANRLYGLTEGWIAGIVLLLRQTKQAPAPAEVSSRRDVLFNYLAREVLDEVDERTRTVLLKTALAPFVTVPMAETLSEVPTAGAVLARLHRIGYFTERRTEDPIRYQYHPMFKEFLLTHARALFGPQAFTQLQDKTAALLAEEGQTEAAVALWMSAQGFEKAARLILAHAPTLLQQGRSQVLTTWIMSLPESLREQVPWLWYWLGVATLPIQPADAQSCFERAFARFQELRDQAGTLMAWAGVVDAIWYTWQDLPQMDQWIARFATLMPDGARYPSLEVETAVTCAMFNALFWRCQDFERIEPWAAQASRMLEAAPVLTLPLALTGITLLNHYEQVGQFGKAEKVLEHVEAGLRRALPSPFAQLAWEQSAANLAILLGDGSQAAQRVAKGLELARHSGILAWNVPLWGAGAWNAMMVGDTRTAQHYVDRMIGAGRDGRGFFHSWTLLLQGWVALAGGEVQRAHRAAEASLALTLKEGPFPEAMSRFTLAQTLCAMGRLAESTAHVTRVEEIARRLRSPLLKLGCRMTAAQFAYRRGDAAAGARELRAAMTLGAEMGLVEWQDKIPARDLTMLCRRALEAGIEPEYVRRLIRAHQLVPDGATADLEGWPWPVKIYTLGRFTLVRDGQAVTFSGKAQKRPVDLLKTLVAFGGREVSEATVLDALWPEADGDAAAASFNMALKRLRGLMGNPKAVALADRKLTINPQLCWVDVWAFERGISDSKNMRQVERALALYRGPFLGTEETGWSLSARERLRAKFLGAVRFLGKQLEARQRWADAVQLYERGLSVDDLAEEFYQQLMLCHDRLGRRGEALSVYTRCKKSLAMHLGVVPSETTQQIYRRLTA